MVCNIDWSTYNPSKAYLHNMKAMVSIYLIIAAICCKTSVFLAKFYLKQLNNKMQSDYFK